MQQLLISLQIMEGELQTRETPFPELLKLLTEQCDGPAAAFYRAVSDKLPRLGEEAFSRLWRQSALDRLGCLRFDELDCLIRLGGSLGRYTLEQQLSALRSCQNVLAARLETGQRQYPEERRLSLGLSASAALLLVILLI